MLNGLNLVADTMWEQYGLMRHQIDHEFWDFKSHDPITNSIYVVGRKQVTDNIEKFIAMSKDDRYKMIFANSAEGSSTLVGQLKKLGLLDLVKQKKILVISGGDMEPEIPYLLHEHFLLRILNFEENLSAMQHTSEIFAKRNKPFKFLFLNGRIRPHRKYLWERFKDLDLLDSSIWTMLDGHMVGSKYFSLKQSGVERMDTRTPLQRLSSYYEVPRYANTSVDLSAVDSYIKLDMFAGEWGEAYIHPAPYVDSYFSLVTETVVEYPFSFRTEKIAKALCVGHPWICATSQGFYRDLKNLGFRTFSHLIDESFDSIDNHQARMERIVDIVQDLCNQDLNSFLDSCAEVCKYNQEHLCNVVPRLQKKFPEQFSFFVHAHQ